MHMACWIRVHFWYVATAALPFAFDGVQYASVVHCRLVYASVECYLNEGCTYRTCMQRVLPALTDLVKCHLPQCPLGHDINLLVPGQMSRTLVLYPDL